MEKLLYLLALSFFTWVFDFSDYELPSTEVTVFIKNLRFDVFIIIYFNVVCFLSFYFISSHNTNEPTQYEVLL